MFIAIDVGGTHIRIGSSLSLVSGQFSDVVTLQTLNVYARDIRLIQNAIHELTHGRHIEKIGISVAGLLNKEQTALIHSPNLHDWEGQPLSEDMASVFDCPVVIANDAVAAGAAEGMFAGHQQKSFSCIVWGSGIGGCHVTKDVRGIHVMHAEPGHQIKDSAGPMCHCGQQGCFEAYVGGMYALQQYGKSYESLDEKMWDQVEQTMAHMLVNISYTFPTPLMVIGGGVMIQQKHRLARMQNNMHTLMKFLPAPTLRIATFGEQNGLIGALALLRSSVEII